MFARLFRASQTIVAGAIVLGLFSLISRVLGLVRDRLLASTFGAGHTLDAYYAAFRIPDFIFNIIVLGALSAGFIPIFSELWERDKPKAWRFAQSILMIVGGGLLIACAVLFFVMPGLMPLITPGFDAETLQLATSLSRIMVLSPLLLGISSVFGGVLQSFKNFLAYALAPVLYNAGIIGGIVFFVPLIGPMGLAWGVCVGAAAHLLLQWIVARHGGWRWQWIWPWREAGLREMMDLMGPRTLAIALNEATLFIVTSMASTLAAGTLTLFNFAHNLAHVPIGLFGISFAVAAFPALSTAAAQGRPKKFRRVFHSTLSSLLVFLLPTVIIVALFSQEIVALVYRAGKFRGPEVSQTSWMLFVMLGHMLAQSLLPVYVRNYYARKNTWYPLLAAGFAVTLNAGLAYSLSAKYGGVGLALSLSISSLVQLIILMLGPRIKSTYRLLPVIRKTMWQSVFAALTMLLVIIAGKGLLAWSMPANAKFGVAVSTWLLLFVGLATYILFLRKVGSREYAQYAELFQQKVRGLTSAAPIMPVAHEDDTTHLH